MKVTSKLLGSFITTDGRTIDLVQEHSPLDYIVIDRDDPLAETASGQRINRRFTHYYHRKVRAAFYFSQLRRRLAAPAN